MVSGGERGIRTPETISGLTVFKTVAFDRSAISPRPNRLSACAPDFFGETYRPKALPLNYDILSTKSITRLGRW